MRARSAPRPARPPATRRRPDRRPGGGRRHRRRRRRHRPAAPGQPATAPAPRSSWGKCRGRAAYRRVPTSTRPRARASEAAAGGLRCRDAGLRAHRAVLRGCGTGRDRLEYTEYGAGDAWVVLLHGQLMPRRMQPAAGPGAGGRGAARRHPRPARPRPLRPPGRPAGLLDDGLRRAGGGAARPPRRPAGGHRRHLAGRQRLARGRRRSRPSGCAGCSIEMPVLDNAVEAGILAFAPLMFAARFLPFTVDGAADGDPADPARAGAVLGRDRAGHLRPAAGVGGGRRARASSSAGSRRRRSSAGRSARPRSWSATPPTRSTRRPTRRCWPRSCRTPRSSGRGASSSGGCGPSG